MPGIPEGGTLLPSPSSSSSAFHLSGSRASSSQSLTVVTKPAFCSLPDDVLFSNPHRVLVYFVSTTLLVPSNKCIPYPLHNHASYYMYGVGLIRRSTIHKPIFPSFSLSILHFGTFSFFILRVRQGKRDEKRRFFAASAHTKQNGLLRTGTSIHRF